MSTRYTAILMALGLFAAVNAHAEELWNKTTAGATETGPRQLTVAVESRFEFVTEQQPDLRESDIIATWQRAGGIQPTPFRILIPAGCFVEQRDRLRVNGTSCGVQVSLDGELLEADGFFARAYPPEPVSPDDPLRLGIRLSLEFDEAQASNLLSTLGGAEISLTIGRESGVAIPKHIDSVAGIDPTPF